MISGRQALGSIDQALDRIHEQIETLQREVADSSDRRVALESAQAADYRELARERLDRIAGDTVIQSLAHAEQQAQTLLAQREDAHRELLRRIESTGLRREQLLALRAQQAATLDSAVEVVDQAEALVQADLDGRADYRQQREAAEAAQRKATHAAEKAERSAAEREAKGQAYRDDPLFMYLWGRQYGLPAYSASGLVRWLDGKVARLIGFADARANFDRLNEIPERLREHAQRLATLADNAYAKLKALDDAARAAAGIPALEQTVAEQQLQLDGIDGEIAEHEADEQRLLDERARFAAGEDAHMQRAVEYLGNEYRRSGLGELRRDAERTPYPEDDVIVARMAQRDAERAQVATGIDSLKDALRQQQQRLVELEGLRTDFKRQRYDRAGSVFSRDTMLPVLLGQFLAGLLDREMLWRVLQEHQRYHPRRSNPGFGSGGLGRGTVWRGGLGDVFDGLGRGGFGGGMGGGLGSGSGGGFRTGGGF